MDIITSFLPIISPFIINFLTQFVKTTTKKATPFLEKNPYRKSILRFVVAILAFVSVIFTAILNGETEVSLVSVETITNAFLTFGTATGAYLWAKK